MSSSNVIKILAEVQRSVCNHARQWDEAARILRDKLKSVTKPTDLAKFSQAKDKWEPRFVDAVFLPPMGPTAMPAAHGVESCGRDTAELAAHIGGANCERDTAPWG